METPTAELSLRDADNVETYQRLFEPLGRPQPAARLRSRWCDTSSIEPDHRAMHGPRTAIAFPDCDLVSSVVGWAGFSVWVNKCGSGEYGVPVGVDPDLPPGPVRQSMMPFA